jgi:hypothetical protein
MKFIHVLDGPVTDNKDMLKIASDYYRDLFSFENKLDIKLKADFFSRGKRSL